MSGTTTPTETPPQNDPPPPDPAVAAARAAASIGAQVILDFNGDGSLGARGGAAATIEENTAAQAAHLVELGLDPAAPSGPPVPPEVVKAKADAAELIAEANASVAAAHATSGAGTATRVSSLAAGIITTPSDVPPPTDTAGGGLGA